MTVAREIANRSQSIVSGTTQAHPNGVVFPCLIHFRFSPHNSPYWRHYIHNFKTFEIYLQVFITRLTTVYQTDVVRKKALVHFTTHCIMRISTKRNSVNSSCGTLVQISLYLNCCPFSVFTWQAVRWTTKHISQGIGNKRVLPGWASLL
jgi:hypothetical protein